MPNGKPWCVGCGHICHCAAGGNRCTLWAHPGKFPNNPAFEWCEHKPCIHGEPGDIVDCELCGLSMTYKNSFHHDCRKEPEPTLAAVAEATLAGVRFASDHDRRLAVKKVAKVVRIFETAGRPQAVIRAKKTLVRDFAHQSIDR